MAPVSGDSILLSSGIGVAVIVDGGIIEVARGKLLLPLL